MIKFSKFLSFSLILIHFHSIISRLPTISVNYPEFLTYPVTTLSSNPNEFAVTGFSIMNSQNHLWWRWFMPSFAERHLFGKNLTANDQINNYFHCHLRFIGAMSESHVDYEPGGYGVLNIPSLVTPILNLSCYYIFTTKYTRVAVYCPILASEDKDRNGVNIADKMCSQFLNSYNLTINITLFPSIYPPLSPPKHKPPQKPYLLAISRSFVRVRHSNIITIREKEKEEFPVPLSSISPKFHQTNHRIAFVAQVFRNTVSAAHLHLFLHHYGKLDFVIVIFDRFGLHYDVVKQYFGQYDIRYHPYTLLQIIQPHIYNDTYKSSLDRNYSFFYNRDKLQSHDNLVSNTDILDLDKQLTFDTARLEYRRASSMFFLDIDEFLFPIEPTLPIQQIEDYYQKSPTNAENWGVPRVNLAGTTPTGKLQPNSNMSRAIIPLIEECLQRALPTVDVKAMHSCYSGPVTVQKHPKFVDTLSVCPFSWNHFSCTGEYNGRKKYSPESITAIMLKTNSVSCYCSRRRRTHGLHLIHLSHQGYLTGLFLMKQTHLEINQTINPLIEKDW